MTCYTPLLLAALAPRADGSRPPSAGYVDSEARPVRCHWQYDADRTRCADVLAAAEDAWAVQVEEVGFAPPVPDDDGVLDIYLTDWGTAGGAYAEGTWVDADPTDDRTSCPGYIAIDPGVPDAELAATVHHEFNHVLQMATDFLEPSLVLWEGTAEAAQLWTDPSARVWTEYWEDFQDTPWMGLLGDGYVLWDDYGLWSYYEYGAEAWVRWLDARWGDGAGAGAAALWEAAAQAAPPNEPDVLDALEELSGWSLERTLLDFAVDRAQLGTDAAPAWAEVADGGPPVALEAELDVSDLPATVAPAVAPYETGAIYVAVDGLSAGQMVRARVAGRDDVSWGIVFVEEENYATHAPTTEGIWLVQEGGRLVVGIVSFGSEDFDGDDPIAPADGVTLELALVEGGGDTGAGDTGADDTGAPPADDTGGAGGDGGGDDGAGDGGATADDGTAGGDGGGCGCAARSGPAPAGLLALAALALARRRRALEGGLEDGERPA